MSKKEEPVAAAAEKDSGAPEEKRKIFKRADAPEWLLEACKVPDKPTEKEFNEAFAAKQKETLPTLITTIENWAEYLETPDWLFEATKVALGGAEGRELTEAQYLAACEHTANTPIGYVETRHIRKAHADVDPTDPKAVAGYAADHIRKKAGAK